MSDSPPPRSSSSNFHNDQETLGKYKMMKFLDDAEGSGTFPSAWKKAAIVTAGAIASIFAVVTLTLTVSHTFLARYSLSTEGPAPASKILGIQNSTLGFDKIFVLNMPTRPDQRDMLTLIASVSNLDFEFFSGASPDVIPEKGLPPGAENIAKGGRGEWIAQMSIYQNIVANNIASALILEDDADWDIRIREQLEDFAKASTVLGERAAMPSHDAEAIHFEDLDDEISAHSPYGDNWDVLWFGHLGVQMPLDDEDDEDRYVTYRDYVVRHNDSTVTQYSQQRTLNNEWWNRDLVSRPDHTRLYHATVQGVGTQGYAISLRGARRALYSLEREQKMAPIDLALRDFCENEYGSGAGETPLCFATSPSLFSQYKNKGPTNKDSNMGEGGTGYREEAYVDNLRYSARDNLGKLLAGRTDFVDRYPDREDQKRESALITNPFD